MKPSGKRVEKRHFCREPAPVCLPSLYALGFVFSVQTIITFVTAVNNTQYKPNTFRKTMLSSLPSLAPRDVRPFCLQ